MLRVLRNRYLKGTYKQEEQVYHQFSLGGPTWVPEFWFERFWQQDDHNPGAIIGGLQALAALL
jgi:hypothetical protein